MMIRKFAMVLLVVLSLPLPAGAVDLRLVYIDQDASPYLAGSGTAVPGRPGIAVELVQRAVSRLGGTLHLTRLPARRMVEEVKAGRQDGILGFRHSEERARDLVFPMRNGQPDLTRYAARLAHSLYRRRGDGITWDGRQVGGLRAPVAVSSTQLVSDALLAQGVEIIRIESSGQMFAMLALGRVDAVVIIDALGDRQMREQGNGQIEKLAPPVLVEDFHVPVSRHFYGANRDFTERLWQSIGSLRDATYAELTPVYLANP
ncbi:MAG: transporter substrate-binding domain-containing protein [Ferrovibrio sp.]|uniref:substrate-binding periplasmic protein n=1 Tax=Ferrovibrio sp. TaxID=1917215 RepID=UPI002604B29E|nr:transporter substrate-binding domain-containing protein [Ferrovibrio sp.]MCW0236051.1 transporter substrate-binding domain-containing protein [Ferrovibrio sp.]